MRRKIQLVMVALVVFGLWSIAAAQSLGDVARETRKQKKPATAKVLTNDDIPTQDTISTVPSTATAAATSDQSSDGSADGQAGDKAANKEEKEQNKDQKEWVAWKDKLAAQKKSAADLEKELDLMEREHSLRVASYYADAGQQLRDSKKWFEEERAYQADLEKKKKDLADTKQKLDDMREEARKAGVPGSYTE